MKPDDNSANMISDDDVFEDSILFNEAVDEALVQVQKNRNTQNNLNDLANRSTLNISALCCDEEVSGYDKLTGQTWIYPTNYSVRDYQFNIIKASILKNTLVSLPTGLGKTFIAAVIMYNFYRWYPLGKIIFTAPTRPLVAQQIEACYNICAIPPADTIEMTGHMQVNTRKLHWKSKRVIFATPQVIYNDIKSGICPGDKIRCLVIDEAHRARGNYAYCQIISTLTNMGHRTYRVLALSATPGSKVDDVVNVVKNLHIAHLELRTENCIDVAPYSHTRKINTVVIPLDDELNELRQHYVKILDDYARRLKQYNILPQNIGNLSKGRIVMLYKEYQNKDRAARHPQHNIIMKDFTLLISLYHGLELLMKHGSRVFLNFFDEHSEKFWIQSDDQLTALFERLRDDLGINPMSLNLSILPDGSIPEVTKNLSFGHPKFYRLKEIMIEHFKKADQNKQDTRAIVFCEYRESVNLIHCLLLQCRPLIKPLMFVGQGASGKDNKTIISQKEQLRVMNNFRQGACNTLVATCVAEEGLDVGNVDLIICFDISTRSPIRLVQRCGRTGRERGGQVFILVTEGREHQTLLDCIRQRDNLTNYVLKSKEIQNNMYELNPRMLPYNHTPECQKMYITVAKKADLKANVKGNKLKKGQRNIRDMLLEKVPSRKSNVESADPLVTREEFVDMYPDGYCDKPYFQESKKLLCFDKETSLKSDLIHDKPSLSQFTTWLEWQRSLQSTVKIAHSDDTKIFSEILQYSDAKRFQLQASTQNTSYSTQMLVTPTSQIKSPVKQKTPKKKQKLVSPAKKDGDIRALFSTAVKSTKSYTKIINDLGLQHETGFPTSIIDLLVDLNIDSTKHNLIKDKCKICENLVDCNIMKQFKSARNIPPRSLSFLATPKYPELDSVKEIHSTTIQDYLLLKESNNFESSPTFHTLKNSREVAKYGEENEKQLKISNNSDNNFDLGDVEDLFVSNTPEEIVNPIKEVTPHQTLDFFGLHSVDDIFAESDDSLQLLQEGANCNKNYDYTQSTKPSNDCPSVQAEAEQSQSPILYSQNNKAISSTPIPSNKTQLRSFNDISCSSNYNTKTSIKRSAISNPNYGNTSKSMYSITQLVNMINDSKNNASNVSDCKNNNFKEILPNTTNEIIDNDNDRSLSPILLTQSDKKAMSRRNKTSTTNVSLIVIDSDSDSDFEDTFENGDLYVDNKVKVPKTPILSSSNKRKEPEDEEITGSPFFSKRTKIDHSDSKAVLLKDKLKLIKDSMNNNNTGKLIESTKKDDKYTNSSFEVHKENFDPVIECESNDCSLPIKSSQRTTNNIESLQIFRRDNKSSTLSLNVLKSCSNKNNLNITNGFSILTDSDSDDFENKVDFPTIRQQLKKQTTNSAGPLLKKIKKKANSFIELEAQISDDDYGSGDELSDDSVGSIAEFICDDKVLSQDDTYKHYLRSVRSPVNGVFKIPYLPKIQDNVCSQIENNDENFYEMDSFCVDSHIGLTQVQDVSELELAEMHLEAERRRKKKNKQDRKSPIPISPEVIKKSLKRKMRQISSDSE